MKTRTSYFSMIFLALFMIGFSACKKEANNKAPLITSVVVNPQSVSAGGTVSVIVTASDPDGDNLTYSYQVTGGSINGIGPQVSWTAPSIQGAHSVTVTVTDGNGGQVSGQGSLNVQAQVTQISGICSWPIGQSGDLANAQVGIYTSFANWNNYQPIKIGKVNSDGSYVISNIVPGNYLLDVWRDVNNNQVWDAGDYWGCFGTGSLGQQNVVFNEIQVVQGQNYVANIIMQQL